MKHRKTLAILAACATVATITACNPPSSKVRGEIIDAECDLTISQNGKRTEVELDAAACNRYRIGTHYDGARHTR